MVIHHNCSLSRRNGAIERLREKDLDPLTKGLSFPQRREWAMKLDASLKGLREVKLCSIDIESANRSHGPNRDAWKQLGRET